MEESMEKADFEEKENLFTDKVDSVDQVTDCHCVKVSVSWVFVVRIQSERGKIRTRKTPNTDTFQAVCDASLNGPWQKRDYLPKKSIASAISKDNEGSFRFCCYCKTLEMINNAWKVSVFGVSLVSIFSHSDWIRTAKTPNTDTCHVVKSIKKIKKRHLSMKTNY